MAKREETIMNWSFNFLKGLAGRDAYGKTLAQLGEEDERIVVAAADCLNSTRMNLFAEKFPDRSFNFGIAEPNMVAAAAGFAMMGKIPVVAGYGFLLSLKCAEQIRDDVCYANRNVKIVATASGFSMATGGVTHHCTEDIPIMRSLANMTIVQPGSPLETAMATRAVILDYEGPVYLRLARDEMVGDEMFGGGEELYKEGKIKFKIGKAITIREGKDITLISSGELVGVAIQAADALTKEGINARVINMHTIKPIDEEVIEKAAEETKGIITVEDTNLAGGLGAAVSEVVCKKHPTMVKMIGVPENKFGPIAPSHEIIWDYFGINVEGIKKTAKEILS